MANIVFRQLQIGKMSDSSGVFAGTNVQVNWKNQSETNEGMGSVTGDLNRLFHNADLAAVKTGEGIKSRKRERRTPPGSESRDLNDPVSG
jgi:hypothetical protein